MKEYISKDGERPWHGDELVGIQQSVLYPLEQYYGRYGACVISGCEITGVSPNFNIAAGIVCIKHADGWKLAKYAGDIGVALPGYLSINKSTFSKDYNDQGTDDAGFDYTATFTAGVVAGSDTQLVIPDPADGTAIQFEDLVGSYAMSDVFNLPSNVFLPGSLNFRVNKISRTLHINGTFRINSAGWSNNGEPWPFALATIPAHMRPNSTRNFTCYVAYDTSDPNKWFKDATNSTYITQLSGTVDNGGNVHIRFLIPQSTIASYDVTVDAVISLD